MNSYILAEMKGSHFNSSIQVFAGIINIISNFDGGQAK